MKRVEYSGCVVLVFLAGVVTANNLSHLIPVNLDYQASWGKVILGVFLAGMFGYLGWKQSQKQK